MLDTATAKRLAGLLAAVGEATRLKLLHVLADGPQHVGRLAALIGAPQASVSNHLGVLRSAGLVADERDGRKVWYRLRPDRFSPGRGDGRGILLVGPYKLHLGELPELHFSAPRSTATVS